MAFVNEYISAENIKQYDIEALDKRFRRAHYKPDWTVDQKRDMFLRYMTREHEEFSNHLTFCFYWKDTVLKVEVISTGGGLRDGEQWGHYKLLRWNLPANLVEKEAEIKADLKEALAAYKDLGVLSNSTVFTATFDF